MDHYHQCAVQAEASEGSGRRTQPTWHKPDVQKSVAPCGKRPGVPHYAVNFVYTEYSELKPVSLNVKGSTIVADLIPQAENMVDKMLETSGIALPEDASVVIGMFSTLLPDYKDSSNTTVEELVAYGGHIIVEVQVNTAEASAARGKEQTKRAFFVHSLHASAERAGSILEAEERLEGELVEAKETKSKLQRDLDLANATKRKLATQAEEKDKSIVVLEEENAREQKRFEKNEQELRTQLERIRQQYGDRAKQVAILEREKRRLQERVGAMLRVKDEMEDLVEEKSMSLKEAHERYDALKLEVERAVEVADVGPVDTGKLAEEVQKLKEENAALRKQWEDVRQEFQVMQTRIENQLKADFKRQLRDQQSAFMKQLQDSLTAQSELFQKQQEQFKEDLLKQFRLQQEGMENKAKRMEEQARRLESEVGVLVGGLRMSNQQYQELMSSLET